MELENIELNEEEKKDHGQPEEDILLSVKADKIPVSIKLSMKEGLFMRIN